MADLVLNVVKALVGWSLVVWTLLDAIEQVILPRNEYHVFRISSLAFLSTWGPWRALARRIKSPERRAMLLSFYGPLSVLGLLVAWEGTVIFGFSLGMWAVRDGSFMTRFYVSGSNFFTLGLSNPPQSDIARLAALAEAGLGLALLAVIIGYLPVYYGAYSTREIFIIRFQSIAGDAFSGLEIVKRFASADPGMRLQILWECQGWAAHVLQSQRSYPLVALYRSQKGNQSWLAILTALLDICAVLKTVPQNRPVIGAPATFEVALRAATDLTVAFKLKVREAPTDRLPRRECYRLLEILSQAGMPLDNFEEAAIRLEECRKLYEPYIHTLSRFLFLELPEWIPRDGGAPQLSREKVG